MGLKEEFDKYQKGAGQEEPSEAGANEEEGAEVIHHKHGKKHTRFEKASEHEEGQGGEDCPMCGGTGKE